MGKKRFTKIFLILPLLVFLFQFWDFIMITQDSGRIVSVNHHRSIHFIYDYDKIYGRSWCTIETVCRAGLNVVVFAKTPSMFEKYPKVCEDRLDVRKLNYSELFQNILLKDWYDSPENRKSPLWKFDVPDAARWAIVKKFGGVYSDLDILYFGDKMFRTTNKVAAQHTLRIHHHYLNGNFLDFQKGHPFVERAITEFVKRYVPNHFWGSPGPGLLTLTLNICRLQGGSDCKDLNVLSADRLQYIRPMTLRHNLERPIKDKETQILRNNLLEHGLGLHLSNSEIGPSKFPIGSLFHSLFSEFCPMISKELGEDLFY